MRTYTTQEELLTSCNFEVRTKNDVLKADAAWALYTLALENGNPGAYGLAAEVLSRRPGSRKTTVSRQGKVDVYFNLAGKSTRAERKTTGGRIDRIQEPFIVYSLDVKNSTGDKTISARIMRTADFLNALREFGAIKKVSHKGIVDGLAVQPSNRKLWTWLEGQLEYDREWTYYLEDFEG